MKKQPQEKKKFSKELDEKLIKELARIKENIIQGTQTVFGLSRKESEEFLEIIGVRKPKPPKKGKDR